MEKTMTRKMIAALQISLDGYTQGEDTGEPGWVDSWSDGLALVPEVDGFVQGAGMYPGYAQYWSAIEAAPKATAPFSDRVPYDREVEYARFAAKTPHYVLSSTLEGVPWPPSARIVRGLDDLRALKQLPGKNLYVVGGATLVTSLLNADLLDELRLIVHPLLLGRGKSLFAGIENRRAIELVHSEVAERRPEAARPRAAAKTERRPEAARPRAAAKAEGQRVVLTYRTVARSM